jgi:hypothetical protein
MLQAAEQNLGLALSREILAADALGDGRLVQLSPVTIVHADAQPYHFVYPPSLRTWPPLLALRAVVARRARRLQLLRCGHGARLPPVTAGGALKGLPRPGRIVVRSCQCPRRGLGMKTMTLVARHLYFGMDPLRLRDAANRVLSRVPEETSIDASVKLDALIEDFHLDAERQQGHHRRDGGERRADEVPPSIGAAYGITPRFRENRAGAHHRAARARAGATPTRAMHPACREVQPHGVPQTKYEIEAVAVHGHYMTRNKAIAQLEIGITGRHRRPVIKRTSSAAPRRPPRARRIFERCSRSKAVSSRFASSRSSPRCRARSA